MSNNHIHIRCSYYYHYHYYRRWREMAAVCEQRAGRMDGMWNMDHIQSHRWGAFHRSHRVTIPWHWIVYWDINLNLILVYPSNRQISVKVIIIHFILYLYFIIYLTESRKTMSGQIQKHFKNN